MTFEVGQLIHRRKGTETVQALSPCMVQLTSGWIPREKLAAELLTGPAVNLVSVANGLAVYVTKLRIVYPQHAQHYLDNLAAVYGVILDPQTRPTVAGKRGGTTVQHTAAAELEFDSNTPANLLPEGVKLEGNRFKLNSLAVAFELLKSGAKQTSFV